MLPKSDFTDSIMRKQTRAKHRNMPAMMPIVITAIPPTLSVKITATNATEYPMKASMG